MLLRITILIHLVILLFHFSYAQKDTSAITILKPQFQELTTLETALQQEVNIATGSFKEASLREIPNIATVITGEEIKHLGVRDFTELLRFIPGFEVGKSDDHVMSLGSRGNWGEEGKILVLLDGNMLNDISYGATPIQNRIPLENIEKIEIIRGPGSAVYGGFASLAVINIITKSASSSGEEASMMLRYGNEKGATSRLNGQITLNQQFRNDVNLSFSSWFNKGNLTQNMVNLPNGDVYDYADSSDFNAYNFNIGFQFRNLNIRFIREENQNFVNPYNYGWYTRGTFIDITHKIKLNNKWTFHPRLSWKQQNPWSYSNTDDSTLLAFNTIDRRLRGNFAFTYHPNEKLSYTIGVESFHDDSKIDKPFVGSFKDGKIKVSYDNYAAFTELTYTSKYANLTIGGRFDDHSAVRPAFVPRFAITKAFKELHFKALYSFAFRAPTVQNISITTGSIKPERIRVAEVELGYRFSPNFSLSFNAFDVLIKDPIVYLYFTDTETYDYINQGQTGSRGFEIEARYSNKWGFVVGNLSYYKPDENSNVEEFRADDRKDVFLGMPKFKSSLRASFNLLKNIWLNPSLSYSSERFTYLPFEPEDSDLRMVRFKPFVLANFNVEWNDILKSGINLSLGANNLLNEDINYISPNNSGILYIPDNLREFLITIRYSVK
jgi:outer membrane receptor protein involved in Fe transport